MNFCARSGLISISLLFACSLASIAQAETIDSTSFVKKLVLQEIRNGEENCEKTMRNAASCKIYVKQVLVSKAGEDTAKLEIISDVKIKTEALVTAGARTEIKAKAIYQLKSCAINITDVSKRITKLTGMAKYLSPFKKSLAKIDVPTGMQPIKSNAIRDRADSYLKKRLKLASAKDAENCEK